MLESIRRFGLEYCDLPSMVDNLVFFLKMCTVDLEMKCSRRAPIIFYITTILTGACYFYVYMVSMLWFVFIRCQETGDLAAACVIFGLTACSSTGAAKLIYIRFNKDAAKNIIEEYLSCDASVVPGTRFSTNLLKGLRNVKKRAMGFWLYLTVNGFIYIVTPLFLPGRHLPEDLYIIYGLEPMFETPNYQIAFAMMTAGVYFGVTPVVNTSSFLTIFTGYTEALMLALKEELDNVWDDAKIYHQVYQEILSSEENIIEEDILNEHVHNQLRDIVEKHIISINLLRLIENMFRGAMTVEFSLLTSSVIAELLGGLENTYFQLPYTLTQIAMECLIGQRLIDASLALENAIYSCKWEYLNKTNQKTVYLMLMNSQKTLTLSVGGLMVLNFAYFMSVLKLIYSAYTTLRSRMLQKLLKSLRRYGLEHCDLPTMIENISFLLKIWTIDIERKCSQRVPVILYVITILTGACYFYVYVVSMFWFVFIRRQETGDLTAACVVFSLAACSLTGVAKLIYMRFYNDTVKDMVEEYLACDALVEPGTRFSTNLLKGLRNVKWRAVAFGLYLTINGIIYITTPIILPGRHIAEDLYVIYGLEPMFETPNYQIAFAMMSGGVYFGVPPEINTSAFLIIFAGYVEAQMLALTEELNNLWDDAQASCQHWQEICGSQLNYNEDTVVNVYVQIKLRDIVKKHITSINLLNRIENMFRGAMAVEFGFLTSGLIAELLGGLENTYIQLPYTLIQVAMDCLIGQRLIDASLVLENAIYSCKWEYFNKSNQKTVYLMLMNSQKTLTLSVGGLTVLSFAYFMSVLKSIYSAYTALRSRM